MAAMFLFTRQWCQVVVLTAGVVGMCKEHLGVALALKVPVFFLVCRFNPAALWAPNIGLLLSLPLPFRTV